MLTYLGVTTWLFYIGPHGYVSQLEDLHSGIIINFIIKNGKCEKIKFSPDSSNNFNT